MFSYTNEELANDEFHPYLELFAKEAKKRGHNFDDYHIDFFFADIVGAWGLSFGDRKILIDRGKWNRGDSEFKESLVFHELGHSALNRKHKNDKTDTGECLSIMTNYNSGSTCSENLYSSLWREYYLDELFESNTPLPNWYLDTQDYDIEDLNKEPIISKSNVAFHIDSIDLDTLSNFVLEVKFNTRHNGTNTVADFSSLIHFNEYNFNAYQYAENKRIYIYRGTWSGGSHKSERMYEYEEYSFNENVKFTIKKNQNIFSFFVDEQFLHATEIDTFEDTGITTSISSETNGEIVMDIEMFQYN